jgi:glycerophosphoryl diester phosphodiesterase
MWNSRLTRPVFIWGHRGAPAIEPENTIRGFLVAGTAGVDGVEFDVQLSNDGVVVVMHDDMLDRTTNASGPVTIKEWAELRTVRVRHPDGTLSDERVPRLEDVLQALPTSLALCIEYKQGPRFAPDLVDQVLELVERFGAGDRVLVSSFDQFSLARSHQLRPDLPTALAWGMGRLVNPWSLAAETGTSVVHVHASMVPGEDVARMQAHNLTVALWGLKHGDEVADALRCSPNALFVDDPSWASELLG